MKKVKKALLVVEDDPFILLAISRRLKDSEITYYTAPSVPVAKEILDEHPEIGAVWLDHSLIGGESGLDLLRDMRKDPKYKDTPAFVLSNVSDPDSIERYKDFGIKEYFVKAESKLVDIITDVVQYLK